MAQGPYRLARGLAYFSYLQSRHPTDLEQKIVEVPGVGHDHSAMFTSDCGIAALFKLNLPQTCPVVGNRSRPPGNSRNVRGSLLYLNQCPVLVNHDRFFRTKCLEEDAEIGYDLATNAINHKIPKANIFDLLPVD
jgi:hypothetical protein